MPASKDQQWKPEEDNLLKKLINEKYSLKKIAEFFSNRSRRAIENRTYVLGLKSGTPRTKHTKNEDFWNIPNPLNCYYAGLAAADMCVQKNRSLLQWQCHIDDVVYMKNFIRDTKFTGKEFYVKNKSPKSDNISIHACLRVNSKKWKEDLAKNFNIVPEKTYRLRPPTFSSDYLTCCYIIGLLDGDGAISWSKSTRTPHIAYGSASKDIVYWFQNFVESKFPFGVRKLKEKNITVAENNSYYRYNIYGLRAIKFIEFLRVIDVPHFSRKWDNPEILIIIEEYKNKFPEFFTPEQSLRFDINKNIVLPNYIDSSL